MWAGVVQNFDALLSLNSCCNPTFLGSVLPFFENKTTPLKQCARWDTMTPKIVLQLVAFKTGYFPLRLLCKHFCSHTEAAFLPGYKKAHSIFSRYLLILFVSCFTSYLINPMLVRGCSVVQLPASYLSCSSSHLPLKIQPLSEWEPRHTLFSLKLFKQGETGHLTAWTSTSYTSDPFSSLGFVV